MERTPTRCGFCGRQTITRAGSCPACGHAKRPPKAIEPPAPPSAWRQLGSQLAVAGALTVLLLVAAIVIGSQVLLFLAILVLCALAVLFVVSNVVP
jgi:hypothetical protein